MNKVAIIIAREYLTRVKKKSFIILTLLAPVLIAGSLALMTLLIAKTVQEETVAVIDENEYFINKFEDSKLTKYIYPTEDIDVAKKDCESGKYDAVLHILKGDISSKGNLFYYKEPTMSLTSNIERQMDKILFDKVLQDTFNIDPVKFDLLKSSSQTSLATIKIDETGKEMTNMAEISKVAGMIFGFIIYFFIFMFASQILRSVLEEKTNRIVEILISSIKPMQLLMGKVIGVALVGLTQFLLWIILAFVLLLGIGAALPQYFTPDNVMEMVSSTPAIDQNSTTMMPTDESIAQAMPQGNILQTISDYIPFSLTTLLLSFVFYFLMGYLLYSALFAAVGSAVDNEADSQQFTLPVTIPLIFTISMVFPIADAPNSSLAFWLSMIPFTSPVAMLVRIPSGVPLWELLLSMAILLAFFFLVIWAAAKIYRIGILMYGKKIGYKDLWKWLKY
ncbi:MAG: ABC transporter permease [Bacteroidales bacterium]|jgi:ABC-2 type transport system permease protein|nr:ABC transporter permease [Bacteroidales bacterium]